MVIFEPCSSDSGEPARGGEGVQQPGQRLSLPARLRQGHLVPHAGAGAGAGAGRQGHRDEGVRRSGTRRPLHAGRHETITNRNSAVMILLCADKSLVDVSSSGPGEGAAVPSAPAGNRSGAAGPSGSGPSLLQPG